MIFDFHYSEDSTTFSSLSNKFSVHLFMDRMNKDGRPANLELSAVQSMAAVLSCGPAFDQSGLNDDGFVYKWLNTLLGAHDEKVCVIHCNVIK